MGVYMGIKFKGALLLSIILAMIVICGCTFSNTTTNSTEGTVKIDASKSIADSHNAIDRIAGYLEANDTQSFADSLSNNDKELMTGSPHIPAEDAAKVAKAMKEATITEAYPDVIFYEMTVDGETYPFNMIKEDGAWKLDGF